MQFLEGRLYGRVEDGACKARMNRIPRAETAGIK